MVGTTITNVKVSSTIVFPGVNFTISGLLETSSGVVLPYKNVTITCAYESFRTMTSGFGVFNSDISFPPGSQAGPTNVTVTYTPYAYSQDVQMYLLTNTPVPVTVEYPQSVLSAQAFTESHALAVTGNLTTQAHTPLVFRNITIYLDGNPVGNTTTTSTGSFAFSLMTETLSNGTHEIVVSYSALNDIYAPSKTILHFDVVVPSNSTVSARSTSQVTQISEATTQSFLTNTLIIPAIATVILLVFALDAYFVVTRRKKPEAISEGIRSSPEFSSDVPVVHCEYCGTLIPRDSNFCDHCGKLNLLRDRL